MIYPSGFEKKIGFDEIRSLLKERCLSVLGQELVDAMTFTDDVSEIRRSLDMTREFRRIEEGDEEFPMQHFFDVRECVARLRLDGTYLEEAELFDLQRSLQTIHAIVIFLSRDEGDDDDREPRYLYPTLHTLCENVRIFPQIVRRIGNLLDRYGRIKDTASNELAKIRRELASAEGSVSRTLMSILRSAQSDGLIDKDVTPTMRDGRLVIPVAPGMKRKISGIVHDESATGKTVFIEPTEVVEANNRIRELEGEERKEIIRILKEVAGEIRPFVKDIIESLRLLAAIDFVHCKVQLARMMKATEPQLVDEPHIDWTQAVHPLLRISLERQGKKVVPLDILLEGQGAGSKGQEAKNETRLLIISGPNAGGKSVCLKTVGLLQYMLQCGLSIPADERSTCGVFKNLMIDIGDEQSLEDDLSTYSSHLTNMKMMIRHADSDTLLLIDEFGTGTEPQIGGAIAEAVLRQFWKKKAWGVITTHYQNLKHFADDHDGVVNGAMLYDRHEMQALFQLAIGRPGSSFAVEIARKIGLPEEVINDATDIVGSDYIQSDKYLQDIVRDKRYWESKRQNIHQHEKRLEVRGEKLDADIQEIERERKAILQKARQQAEELLREANRRIENTIREIRESQAEKEETRRIREELKSFEQEVVTVHDGIMSDEDFARKLQQMEQRKERKAKRHREKAEREQHAADALRTAQQKMQSELPLKVGDTVHIKGQTTIGTIEAINGNMATALFGGMRTKVKVERLERTDATKKEESKKSSFQFIEAPRDSRMTRAVIDAHRHDFKQDIDLRGMRADEALNEVQHFIDDAILMGVSRVRILHGKGNGILRQLIRQYLRTVPNVTDARDEHVQFGGAGITVVEIS